MILLEAQTVVKQVDWLAVAQIFVSGVVTPILLGFMAATRKHRKREEKRLTLFNMKLEAMYAGMCGINSQFITIGKDFKRNYDEKLDQQKSDINFIEDID